MRILIIDDEYVALKKMKHLLEPYGDVDTVTNGKQALDMYSKAYWDKNLYDLFTIDIDMPEMDGIEVLERICDQENSWSKTQRSIYITNSSISENIFNSVCYIDPHHCFSDTKLA